MCGPNRRPLLETPRAPKGSGGPPRHQPPDRSQQIDGGVHREGQARAAETSKPLGRRARWRLAPIMGNGSAAGSWIPPATSAEKLHPRAQVGQPLRRQATRAAAAAPKVQGSKCCPSSSGPRRLRAGGQPADAPGTRGAPRAPAPGRRNGRRSPPSAIADRPPRKAPKAPAAAIPRRRRPRRPWAAAAAACLRPTMPRRCPRGRRRGRHHGRRP